MNALGSLILCGFAPNANRCLHKIIFFFCCFFFIYDFDRMWWPFVFFHLGCVGAFILFGRNVCVLPRTDITKMMLVDSFLSSLSFAFSIREIVFKINCLFNSECINNVGIISITSQPWLQIRENVFVFVFSLS